MAMLYGRLEIDNVVRTPLTLPFALRGQQTTQSPAVHNH